MSDNKSKEGVGMIKTSILGSRLSRAPSYNEILPRLYLGDICTATNKAELERVGITDLITIEIKPLASADLAACIKRYLFINVMDHSKQDIISHFDTSNQFIEDALKDPNNKILVHCVAGISRSASLVIAYVMKSRSMDYTEARELVVQKRRIVDPNEGFVRQLVLYRRMGYKIDIANMDYRRLMLDALVFEFRLISLNCYQTPSGSAKTITTFTGLISSPSVAGAASNSWAHGSDTIHLPASYRDITTRQNIGILFDHYYNKLHLQEVSKYPDVYNPNRAFRCNKCRSIVFYAISVIENKLDSNTSELPGSGGSGIGAFASGTGKQSKQNECPFIFIEPQPWMSRNVLDKSGQLECYKCKRKLGKYDWISNESCSCALHNSHINFNLFKIMKRKVDRR